MGIMDAVTISKDNIPILRRTRFCADLQTGTPVTPNHAVFNQNIFQIPRIPADHAFEYNAIVKATQKTVFQHTIAAIEEVHTVGIVPPVTDNFYIIHY